MIISTNSPKSGTAALSLVEKKHFGGKSGFWPLRKNQNGKKKSKSSCTAEIMLIVSSFGHNKHLFIQKSIQNYG